MARQDLSKVLRVADMIQIDTATVGEARVLVPLDWQESDFVRIVGGNRLDFKPRPEFYAAYTNNDRNDGFYTQSGRYLIIGGPIDKIDSMDIELHYFGDLPVLAESGAGNWVTTRYLTMYTFQTLSYGSGYGLEDERALTFAAQAKGMIDAANMVYLQSKASGSRLNRRAFRSFG
jgi:hypothetical protein